MTMKPVFTIDDIRSWKPCYDPARFLPEGWSGTALDILAVEDCPANDRLWVVLREEALSARTARLFAVAVARAALALVENPDPRSIVAVDVAERHANGEASGDELDAARAAARCYYLTGNRWNAKGTLEGITSEEKQAAWKIVQRNNGNDGKWHTVYENEI